LILLDVLCGNSSQPPPIWMMRQAGRYLPEYRQTREKAGSFLGLCNSPELAAEVTLQPINRFGFDAAVIFSDILVVPMALGHEVRFEEGPKLEPLTSANELGCDKELWANKFSPVYEALRLVRAELDSERALLGFAGAAWTLATYLAGGGSDKQEAARLWAYRDPTGFGALIDILVECIYCHLIGQLDAGADAVQIFDSWAGGLTSDLFERWVVTPTARIVEKVRMAKPKAKIIGFPRGASQSGLERYAGKTGVDAISLDPSVDLGWAMKHLETVLQGNLDPLLVVAGGKAQSQAVDAILDAVKDKPFIFNLGHGVLPQTPIEHVKALVDQVRSSR
jgi:uroporphyrinogen decarboxylase